MQRYKIIIEYDGTDLVGWQKQQEGESAQGCLEQALFGLTQQHIEVFAAGRTDAGVHALAQAAHFDLETNMPTFRIREALNAHLRDLKSPVAVLEVEEAAPDFHARFSARGRGYLYRILNRRARSVLLENRVWHVPYPLDVEQMRQGAVLLLGHHDFSAFRGTGCQALSPVKTLDRLDIVQNGEEIDFIVEARSFLYHQVRNMVGTLKMVGDGHFKPQDVQTILESGDRRQAGPTAPACGLYLNKVVYD
jgi:tRNA pseudouridine38-40 synthase